MPPWRRTYWVVFFANLITAVGMMSFLPFFPSILEAMGLEDRDEIALWSGVAFGAAPLAAAIMGPIWGSIGDRFGRKAMVLRALLAITFFVGSMGFARTPWQLLALRLGQGVFSGFVPPSITLVSIGTPRDLQGRVTGSLQASLAAGSIVGPLLGAAVQATLGIRWVFAFVALLSALAAVSVGLFAHEEPGLRQTLERWSPTAVLSGAFGDLRDVLANPRIRAAVIVLFSTQFGLGATNPLMELFVRDLWTGAPELAPQATAWLFTSMACAALVGTPLWGRVGDAIGHPRALTLSALATAVLFGAHAAAAGFALLLAARVGMGLVSAGPNAAAFGVAATASAVENRGVAFGAVFSARAFAVSLGALAGGGLASALGLRTLFLLAGSLVVVVLVTLRPGSSPSSRPPDSP